MSGWSQANRGDAALCAAVLHTAWLWWGLGCLMGLACAVMAWCQTSPWIWLGGLGVCVAQSWLTLRCQLDARLFSGVACLSGPWQDGDALDESLQRVLGVRRPRLQTGLALSDMGVRIAGALGLYRRLVGLTLLEALAVGLLGVWTWGRWPA